MSTITAHLDTISRVADSRIGGTSKNDETTASPSTRTMIFSASSLPRCTHISHLPGVVCCSALLSELLECFAPLFTDSIPTESVCQFLNLLTMLTCCSPLCHGPSQMDWRLNSADPRLSEHAVRMTAMSPSWTDLSSNQTDGTCTYPAKGFPLYYEQMSSSKAQNDHWPCANMNRLLNSSQLGHSNSLSPPCSGMKKKLGTLRVPCIGRLLSMRGLSSPFMFWPRRRDTCLAHKRQVYATRNQLTCVYYSWRHYSSIIGRRWKPDLDVGRIPASNSSAFAQGFT